MYDEYSDSDYNDYLADRSSEEAFEANDYMHEEEDQGDSYDEPDEPEDSWLDAAMEDQLSGSSGFEYEGDY